jgi:hypothetical protein
MPKYKKRLVVLLCVQGALTVLHKILEKPPSVPEHWFYEAGWHFWLGLGFGIFVVLYAWSIRCKECGAGQVFRGLSFFDIRWPGISCWRCDSEIA